ncbi:hypothetical protein, partial [Glutamicibacter arilaitensis]|uniref:hypothetical protein n=1 Tax=Glutamicibacter arilaitensis TaxID=256701 RepID=UPI003FD1E4D4
MNIELLAVNKVNDALLYCPHLEPAIDSLDRIAFTDGHIDLHSETDQHTNQNFVGRVSVQVKGKTVSNLDSYKPTFSIETAALKAYAGTGGVLYFVVFMGKRGQSASAHYRILTPFFIEELLRGTKPKQKSKTVQLRKLPSRTEEI